MGSAVASVVVVVVASIARWDLDGGATSASMTRSGSGAAGAATAIAGSTADAGAALDGAALAGALSNAAASRELAAAAEDDRAGERGEGDDGERRPRLATEAARRRRRANRRRFYRGQQSRGCDLRAEDARRLLDGLGEGMRAICRGHRNDPPLRSFERAHDCLIIAATVGMAVAAHCDGRH